MTLKFHVTKRDEKITFVTEDQSHVLNGKDGINLFVHLKTSTNDRKPLNAQQIKISHGRIMKISHEFFKSLKRKFMKIIMKVDEQLKLNKKPVQS